MAITISGNGITSANIADGTITTDDINASDVTSLKSGRKNLIINGAMQVAQRGTSFTGAGNGDYSLDRFVYTNVSDAVVDIHQTADAPTTAEAGVDFVNCLHVDVTTADTAIAAGQLALIQQIIENKNILHLGFGQSGTRNLTLSFWVKATQTGTYCASLKSFGHTRAYASEYTVSSADTWEKKTITIPVDVAGSWSTENLNVQFILAAGSTYHITGDTWTTTSANYSPATSNQVNALASTANNFKVTGVQLEVGDTATDFEHRSYGEELALCQRYYENNYHTGYPAHANDGTLNPYGWEGVNSFKVEKRASPTMTPHAPWAAYSTGNWAFFDGGIWAEYASGIYGNKQGYGWSRGGVRHRYPVIGGWEADAEL